MYTCIKTDVFNKFTQTILQMGYVEKFSISPDYNGRIPAYYVFHAFRISCGDCTIHVDIHVASKIASSFVIIIYRVRARSDQKVNLAVLGCRIFMKTRGHSHWRRQKCFSATAPDIILPGHKASRSGPNQLLLDVGAGFIAFSWYGGPGLLNGMPFLNTYAECKIMQSRAFYRK